MSGTKIQRLKHERLPKVTPELLQEWRWLRRNQNHHGDPPRQSDEWSSRWKQFYARLDIFWGDFCGPFEATTERPDFDTGRQPHRYVTWLQGRAWRAALLEAEAAAEREAAQR